MKTIFGLRGRRFAFATVAIFAVAGGIAYAAIPDASGVYHACVMKNGSIRIIDPSTDQCRPSNETEITFNQKGQTGDPGAQGPAGTNGTNGADGKSPTVAPVAVGDSHCVAGGAAITDAAGHTAYVCSGQDGTNGANGEPFSGTFTSPSGDYSISVTDTGVTIKKVGGSSITLTGNDVRMHSDGAVSLESALGMDLRGSTDVEVQSGESLNLKSGTDATLEGGTDLTVKGVVLTVQGDASAAFSSGGLFAVTGGLVTVNSGGSSCQRAAPVAASSVIPTQSASAADAFSDRKAKGPSGGLSPSRA